MAKELLPAASLLYSELLDHCVHAMRSPRGISFISRPVKGRRYWYMQWTVGSQRTSHYLGPDDAPLRERIERTKARFQAEKPDRALREKLVAMFTRAGGGSPDASTGRVLEVLEQTGLFQAGAVLVGSHAFSAIGNMLGVSWPGEMTRTQDIDIAGHQQIHMAVPDKPVNLSEALKTADEAFFPVPALDPRHASTSFAIRGKQLRVDLLTPLTGRPKPGPVQLPGLGISAFPIRFLDYLLDDTQPAVIPFRAGALVNVPSPARFAFHKLVVAERRPSAQSAKARKDRFQAASLLEVLLEQRPGDLHLAAEGLNRMPGRFKEQLQQGVTRLPDEIKDEVLDFI